MDAQEIKKSIDKIEIKKSIDKIIEIKHEHEKLLAEYIAENLGQFKKKTGYLPDQIYIDLDKIHGTLGKKDAILIRAKAEFSFQTLLEY